MKIILLAPLALSLIFSHRAGAMDAIPSRWGSVALAQKTMRLPKESIPPDIFSTRGGLGYTQFCAACHGRDGEGVKGIFPPLVRSRFAATSDPSFGPADAFSQSYSMPSFSRLSDQELSDILSFVRKSRGPDAAPKLLEFRENFGPKAAKVSGVEVPRLADLLDRPNRAQLIFGMRLVVETKALLPKNAGNELNCASCHLNGGTVPLASPFIGIAASFPGYSPRAGRIITLEDRINGCFIRSMNGKPLPAFSPEMKAMVAYLDWMKGNSPDRGAGRGVGKINRAFRPDSENGKKVYSAQCAACHGKVGQGLLDASGRYVYPPLWGERSFNLGAGMARTFTAASFTKQNMPIGVTDNFPLGQGGLSDRDAVDVAFYFSHQARADFSNKTKDWPKGGKPGDARY